MKTLEDLKFELQDVKFRLEELRSEIRGLEENKMRLIQEIHRFEEN